MKRKNLVLFLWCIIFMILGFFSYQGFIFYQLNIESNKLIALKKEYKVLSDEISDYKQLKSQYEILFNVGNDLNNNKETLENKINGLNKDIKDLENKINDVNKKIKSIS